MISSAIALVGLIRDAHTLLQDTANGVSAISQKLDSRQRDRLNTLVRELYFSPGGMLKTLESIKRTPSIELVEVLRSQYEDSAEKVADARIEIRRFYSDLGGKSMRQYHDLQLITESFGGKDFLRSWIQRFVDQPERLENLRDIDIFVEEVDELINAINSFNEALIVFHDRESQTGVDGH